MQKSRKPLLNRTAVALGAAMAISGAAVLPATTAQAADTRIQLAACKANPCAGKNPCAAKKASNPCASKNPCAAKKASNPCAGKNPCGAKKACSPCKAKK